MKIRQVVLSFVGMIVKLILAVLIVLVIYKVSVKCYDFAYRIFAEKPMCNVEKGEEPQDVTVAIVAGKSVKQVAQILKDKGLIRDTLLFQIQEMLSGDHGKMRPGVYTFNTGMSPKEMISMMVAGNTDASAAEQDAASDFQPDAVYDENIDYGNSEDSFDDME